MGKKTRDIYDYMNDCRYYKEEGMKIIIKVGINNSIDEKLEKVIFMMKFFKRTTIQKLI